MTFKAKPFYEKWTPDPNTGCWLWTSGWDSDGYGLMTGNVKAHRASYEISIGPIPKGMLVCHRCDTPACVNPAHLFLGTNKENTNDRDNKGRTARGERGAHKKLTSQQVADIFISSESKRSLASAYGVTHGMITAIRQRRVWRHVTNSLI